MVVDGIGDIGVVNDGIAYLSHHDIEGATSAILGNNDLKWTHDVFEASGDLDIKLSQGLNVNLQWAYYEGGGYFTIHRNSDNKVMKFEGHPEVDLTPFVYKGG